MTVSSKELNDPIVEVDDLTVELTNGAAIVRNASFSVAAGELLGLVGESGSGKTTTALALLGFTRAGVRIGGGSVRIRGVDMLSKSESEVREFRGKLVSYVAQDPGASLNPSLRVRSQVAEMIRCHTDTSPSDEAVTDILERVELPGTATFKRRFIHQLSGGQQQRLAIAIALVCSPPVVVMDEPTTGLDVVTQARILDEIKRLKETLGLSIVYITHNLAVVRQIADRVAVMYGGRIVEEGPVESVVDEPRHPYTRGLLAAVLDHIEPRNPSGIPGSPPAVGDDAQGCTFAARCEARVGRCEIAVPELEEVANGHLVRCFEWRRLAPTSAYAPLVPSEVDPDLPPVLAVKALQADHRTRHGTVVAAHDVSFTVLPRESVAIVGESGSGKTTIARCIAGLHAPTSGEILLTGVPLSAHARDRPREVRRRIQIVFQNPYDSLNPRRRISDQIVRPARLLRGLSADAAQSEAANLLERVALPRSAGERYPAELSGGQRQRVAIARALAAQPELLICDEITSALDVSVQAAVLELLSNLRAELDLSILFISHDLGVVASVADRVLVLERGVIREEGRAGGVLTRPTDAYTKLLVDSVPRLVAGSRVAEPR